jgi:ubiquitin-like protein Pup
MRWWTNTAEATILQEIDSVLEENAEEFVKSYIRRGGEGRPADKWIRPLQGLRV